MRLLTRDRSFYRTLIALAIPISLQNLITFAVGFADNLMIGRLGDNAISGVYVGGQVQTVVQMFIGGVEGAILILAAQYWGKKDTESIRRVVSIGVKLAAAVGFAFSLVTVLFPGFIIGLFTKEAGVIAEGTVYLQIVGFTYLFFSVSQVMIASMRSVETAKIGLYISIMALIVNVGLNYVLIFGKLGLPALGVRGAAVATLISRVLEASVSVGYVFIADRKLKLGLKDLLRTDRQLLRDFIKYGMPIIGGQVVWSVNMLANTKIMGVYSAGVMAAVSITGMLHNLIYVWMNGLSSAVGIITGKTVGAGQYEKMKEYARTVQVIFLMVGVLSGGIVLLARDGFVSLYDVTPEALSFSREFINVISVTIVGTCYQAACLFGLVKSGGDISFVFKNDTIFVFLVVLPSAIICQWLGAPAWVVFAALKCDQILKCFVAVVKINRFNWMKNLTRDSLEATDGQA
ncbi:MAG: MATE family efflux transporter [Acutalibacter sp.]|jgi:putative MATE family efflux protein|uniref:MATE family efflux transporter n=1 Tax=Acutalibacter sp. TaxID=1918636 RepID=UPI0021745109|nr:MATE family efflux transporter [Acutalibacter sp.]MCI9223869.1 MATE family efflux transporter [Acutalibacter sp.]